LTASSLSYALRKSAPADPLTLFCCEHAVLPENTPRTWRRPRDCRPVVTLGDRHFLYWRDPLCLGAAATYVGYRCLIPIAWQTALWSGHFADLLLIPAGLPLWLWLERRIGWRSDDQMPRWCEIAFALVTWTVAAELIAPRMFSQATGDMWDAVAYACGAVIAGLWWRGVTGLREAVGDLTPQHRSMPHDGWSESGPDARLSPSGIAARQLR